MPNEFSQLEWDARIEDECRRIVRAAVLEDLDRGQDWTTVALVPMDAQGRANIVARAAGVVCGLPAMRVVIDEMDRRIEFAPACDEGSAVRGQTMLGSLSGPARSLLTAERLMLNILGRLSGIATLTRKFVDAVARTRARIYDTRKTTPGWRLLEKYAVRQGGGQNHRLGLFDAVLIKDNHLALGRATRSGAARYAPAEAVRRARQFLAEHFAEADARRQMIVEVEVDSLAQLEEVLAEKPDLVLLDNMSVDDLSRVVQLRDRLAGDVELEASGGVSLASVGAIAATGVDRISVGGLTHSAACLDVALDWIIE